MRLTREICKKRVRLVTIERMWFMTALETKLKAIAELRSVIITAAVDAMLIVI